MTILLSGTTNMWMTKPKKNQIPRWMNINRVVLSQCAF